MARRRHSRKRSVARKGVRAYKRCIVAKLRKRSVRTPKQVRKAFGVAMRACRKKLTKKAAKRRRKAHRKKRRKAGKRRKRRSHRRRR